MKIIRVNAKCQKEFNSLIKNEKEAVGMVTDSVISTKTARTQKFGLNFFDYIFFILYGNCLLCFKSNMKTILLRCIKKNYDE